MTGSPYQFARQPKWLLSHLLVLALILAMIGAGVWQLHRLDQRQASNDRVEARSKVAVTPIDDVLASGAPGDIEFRRVSLSGQYDPDGEYLIANRTLDGVPGFWVFTPLVRDGATDVAVNRGFIARAIVQQQPASVYGPPGGDVTVEGLLLESVGGGRVGRTDELRELSRPDVGLLAAQTGRELAPMYVQSSTQIGDEPEVLEPPDRGDGPHLSYAFQWFIFATIALVGYPMILRRRANAPAPSDSVPRHGTHV